MKLHIDVTRHGNATKVEGIDDLWRPLSPFGIEQAIAARARYNGSASDIKLVLHSPAPRASCTAATIVGKERPRFKLIEEIWTPRDGDPMNEALWVAFETHGYAVEKYLSDPAGKEALDCYGHETAAIVLGEIRAFAAELPLQDGDVVVVAGHAVCNNYLAYHLTGCKEEALLKIEMGEASCIRLVFEDGNYVGYEYKA